MSVSDSPQVGIYTRVQPGSRNTTMIFDEAGVLDLTSGKLKLPGSLALGYIDLSTHLLNARELASAETLASGSTAPTYFFMGVLGPDTTPAMALNSTADLSFYLSWVSGNTDAIKLPPIYMPGDMATGGGLTIGLFGESVGTGTASDAKSAFLIKTFCGIGNTSQGSTHPDFTSTPSLQTIAIASGVLTTDVLNLTLAPQTHAGRAIRLYGGRVTYTKRTS